MNKTFWMIPDKVLSWNDNSGLPPSQWTDYVDPAGKGVSLPLGGGEDFYSNVYDRFMAAANSQTTWAHRVVYGYPNPPTDLLAITSVTMLARYWREQYGNDLLAADPVIVPFLYFPASNRYFAGTPFTITAANFVNRNVVTPDNPALANYPLNYTFTWNFNPMTGVAWTQADMAGTFGAGFACGAARPPGTGVHLRSAYGANQAAVCFSQCILQVEATQVSGGNWENIRQMDSYLLKLQRRAPRTYSFMLPLEAAEIEPGESIFVAEESAPMVDAGQAVVKFGWTPEEPRRLIVLETEISPDLTVKITAFDPREFTTHFWSPFRSSINDFTALLSGVAKLDGGFPGAAVGFAGGFRNLRNQLGYVERVDGLVTTVPIDVAKINHVGWNVDGEKTVTHTLNSAFSQGTAGATVAGSFTNWQLTGSLAGFAEELADYLYDLPGQRRSLKLLGTVALAPYVSQAHVYNAGNYVRVCIEYKNLGGYPLSVILQSDAAQSYDFINNVWGGLSNWYALPFSNTKTVWWSPPIQQPSGRTSLTLHVGSVSGQIAQHIVYEAKVVYNSENPALQPASGTSRLPTTTVAVARVPDDAYIVSDPDAVPGIDPRNGNAVLFTYTPKFGPTDVVLGAGKRKTFAIGVWASRGFYDVISFQNAWLGGDPAGVSATRNTPRLASNNGALITSTRVGEVFPALLVVGVPLRFGLRWTGARAELGKLYSYALWVNGTKLGEATWAPDYVKPVVWSGSTLAAVVRNTVTKVGGTAGWDGGAVGNQQYIPAAKDGGITFIIPTSTDQFMVGLTKLPNSGVVSFGNLRYAWYCSGAGMLAYENSVQVYTNAGVISLDSSCVGRIEINRSTGLAYYYINDVFVYSSVAEAVDLYPQVAIATVGGKVQDVCFFGADVVGPSGSAEPQRLIFTGPAVRQPSQQGYVQASWHWGPAAISDFEHKPFAPTDEEMARWSRG